MSAPRKVLINVAPGGYGLAPFVATLLKQRTGLDVYDAPRDNPVLIELVEVYGVQAADPYATLAIVTIKEPFFKVISDDNGSESIVASNSPIEVYFGFPCPSEDEL